ncbi:ribose 1,5-bisphosphokinase PhnN [Alkalibacillus filiformis]|uniref:Ribose 1,5-bisphosphokinase PhnN n=1 Tax=Alkalibacillus filiformis TaxID=200990 RepID=A0ABU0DQN5_9BACI|nr:hypothetical protein [Alkalibacillus filiformis]MDQ0350649.1 ribose 1,5-bisphosphokinase PhnN [Alkalibacillus filiformis]
MSWKAVEMQVALPRTQDASQLQDQLQQRGQLMQDQITQEQLRELERKRKAVLESEQTEQIDNEDENQKSKAETGANNHNQAESKDRRGTNIPHPYLGNRVDFTK